MRLLYQMDVLQAQFQFRSLLVGCEHREKSTEYLGLYIRQLPEILFKVSLLIVQVLKEDVLGQEQDRG